MATSVTSTGVTFPDATTQTTAYVAGGGVSSVNGQTGAVVTTNVASIGCTMILMYGYYSDIAQGTTCAGSILYNNYSAPTYAGGGYSFSAAKWQNGGSGYGGSGTAQSGTWRKMSAGSSAIYQYYGCCYYATSFYPTLFVRIS